MAEKVYNSALYRFAVTTTWFTVLLLIVGAMVTSNQAGDSVPDWPLAYHKLIPPLVGGVRFEYSHRVVAGIVAIMTFFLAIWIAAADRRRQVRRLGWNALALVIAQAILGGMRVLDRDPGTLATLHAILAQLFFIVLVSLALFLSPWWQRDLPVLEDKGTPRAVTVTGWTTFVIFVQLILGACFRHGVLGIMPHLAGACVVTVFVVWSGRVVRKRFRSVRELRRGSALLHSAFGIQILLGITTYWGIQYVHDSTNPTLLYDTLTVSHVLFGALTLASSLLLALSCYRMTPHAKATAAASDSVSLPQHAADASGKAGA
ncbi:MAG TPA: COX15/CtaA family protein [Candidatus Acidoferrales bacterium]|nr:COX15/CtaA family protein [Candidatus Acidoferrales bacterium]